MKRRGIHLIYKPKCECCGKELDPEAGEVHVDTVTGKQYCEECFELEDI